MQHAVFSEFLVASDCVEHVCHYTAFPNIISYHKFFKIDIELIFVSMLDCVLNIQVTHDLS